MFKTLREQSKAKTSSKLSRLMGKGGAGDATSGDEASKVSTKAKKKAEPITVDGNAARARLDRPGRKMRADGGATISEDSKQEVANQRSKAKSKNLMYGLSGAAALGSGALAAATKFNRLGNAGIAGFNALMAKDSRNEREAATKEADRIEKGQVKEGQEGVQEGMSGLRAVATMTLSLCAMWMIIYDHLAVGFWLLTLVALMFFSLPQKPARG